MGPGVLACCARGCVALEDVAREHVAPEHVALEHVAPEDCSSHASGPPLLVTTGPARRQRIISNVQKVISLRTAI